MAGYPTFRLSFGNVGSHSRDGWPRLLISLASPMQGVARSSRRCEGRVPGTITQRNEPVRRRHRCPHVGTPPSNATVEERPFKGRVKGKQNEWALAPEVPCGWPTFLISLASPMQWVARPSRSLRRAGAGNLQTYGAGPCASAAPQPALAKNAKACPERSRRDGPPAFIPAALLIGFWFLTQLVHAGEVAKVQTGGVAYLAHVGGFIFGAVTARWFEQSRPALKEAA